MDASIDPWTSIAIKGSFSFIKEGSYTSDHGWAALAAAGGVARSGRRFPAKLGSEGEGEMAYSVRVVEVKLEVALVWRGAHRDESNRSLESVVASGSSVCRRGRSCSSPQGKRKVWLDAH